MYQDEHVDQQDNLVSSMEQAPMGELPSEQEESRPEVQDAFEQDLTPVLEVVHEPGNLEEYETAQPEEVDPAPQGAMEPAAIPSAQMEIANEQPLTEQD